MSSADARSCALALLIAVSIGVAVEARAEQDARFRRLSTDDGLSHDVVCASVQDHRGHLWVGTMEGGLNALDQATGDITRYLPDDLVRAADKALYVAKHGGRNRVEIPPRRARAAASDSPTSSS